MRRLEELFLAQKMDNNKWWSLGKNAFKVVVTLGAFYWLYTRVSFSELKDGLLNCNPWLLILAFISYVVSQIVASSRLKSFFRANGIMLTERYNLRLYQLGLLYNYFLPGGIGGDAYKIYLLRKRFNYSGKKLLPSVFFDRLSGLWAMCIYISVLIMFMPRLAIPNLVTISAMVVGTMTYYYILRLFFKPFTKNFLITHFKALLVQGFQALAAVLILYALGFEGKFSPYILVFIVSSIVALVPSLLGGLGLRESFSGFFAKYLQISDPISVLMVLLFNFISILVASSGIYYILRPQGLGADKLPSAKEVEQEIEQVSTQEES